MERVAIHTDCLNLKINTVYIVFIEFCPRPFFFVLQRVHFLSSQHLFFMENILTVYQGWVVFCGGFFGMGGEFGGFQI